MGSPRVEEQHPSAAASEPPVFVLSALKAGQPLFVWVEKDSSVLYWVRIIPDAEPVVSPCAARLACSSVPYAPEASPIDLRAEESCQTPSVREVQSALSFEPKAA